MGAKLLHYRAWRGAFHGPGRSPWPMARAALRLMFRRKIFWALYAFGMLTFLMFFFGQYLLAWAEMQAGQQSVRVLGVRSKPADMIALLRVGLRLDGSGESYRNFFNYQSYTVMIVLALAGTLVVGNDFQYGSLPFYLSKPLQRWHYVAGKCLAISVFVNLMITLPAMVLFLQYRTLYEWGNLGAELTLLAGILAYGLLLAVVLSLLLMALASGLPRTVPLIMAWTTLFAFLPMLMSALVSGLGYDVHWKLLDLWSDTYVIGCALLGVDHGHRPKWPEAALVLGGTCVLCVSYLNRRIRAVEIVR